MDEFLSVVKDIEPILWVEADGAYVYLPQVHLYYVHVCEWLASYCFCCSLFRGHTILETRYWDSDFLEAAIQFLVQFLRVIGELH